MAVAIAVETSENRKLGAISTTYASLRSCPESCPWSKGECYAMNGPTGFVTRRLSREEAHPDAIAREEARAIDALTGDRLLRGHVVGDCPTDRSARTFGAAAKRYARRGMMPRRGRKVWTYTHAWRTVKRASWGDYVSVLASVETARDAQAAMAKGYAAAIVVATFERESAYVVDGVGVVPCPNQTRGVSCRDCGLCRDDERLRSAGLEIAFEAHGRRAPSMRVSLEMVS